MFSQCSRKRNVLAGRPRSRPARRLLFSHRLFYMVICSAAFIALPPISVLGQPSEAQFVLGAMLLVQWIPLRVKR